MHHVQAGEVRDMSSSNEEGSASQGSVRPASWQQQHKPDCYLVRKHGL